MSSNSSALFYLSNKLKKHIDDKRVLAKKITWYSNGPRGFLHGSTRCYKINRNVSTVTNTLTIGQALEKRICEDCYQKGLLTIIPNLYEVNNLITISDYASRFSPNSYSKDLGVEKVYENITNLRTNLRTLTKIRDSVHENYFSNFHEEVTLNLKDVLKNYLLLLEAKKADLVTDVIMKLLLPESTFGPDEVNFEKSTIKLFAGEDRYTSRNFSALYTSWISSLNTLPPIERESSVLSKSRDFKLSSTAQLEGIALNQDAKLGTDLTLLIESSWRLGAEQALASEVQRWEKKADHLYSLTNPKILAVYMPRFRNDGYLSLIIDAFKVNEVNSETHVVILRAPEVVGKYLERSTVNAYSENKEIRPFVMVDDQLQLDEMVLLTASSLWSPDSSGVYKDFEKALQAAQTL